MYKFAFALAISSLGIFSSHAVDVNFGFDDNVQACVGDDVTVIWQGYHNIQETRGSDCNSGNLAQIEGYFGTGFRRTYSNNALTAYPGQRRYFKCTLHCGEFFNRFEVYCPADDTSPRPTAVQTPTPAPTEFECFDDPDFRHQGKAKKSCLWISRKKKRKKKLCKKRKVSQACKIVCDKCCADDPTRTFEVEGIEYTCGWLWQESRKREQCTRDEVNSICPKQCGRCCSNDKEFEIDIGTPEEPKVRKCGWFKKKKRADKWCEREPSIAEACQKSCNSCEDYTVPVEEYPTVSPSASPTD